MRFSRNNIMFREILLIVQPIVLAVIIHTFAF